MVVDVDGTTNLAPDRASNAHPSRIVTQGARDTTLCARKTLSAGGTLDVQVTGEGGVPSGASAVVANVTVTGAPRRAS